MSLRVPLFDFAPGVWPLTGLLLIAPPLLGADDNYLREIEEEGALLVRPDGVVAWRRATGVSDVQQARSELIAVLSKILAMPKELA